jgi:putative FmdB family regulatory protein
VPTYEYACDKCLRVFETRQRISEAPLTTCEVCGGNLRRLLSAAPFILKGDGWYVTDYPSEARRKARESEKPPADKTAASAVKSEKPGSDTAGADSAAGSPTTSSSAPASSSTKASD